MSSIFPNGTIFSISTGYGAAKVIDSMTNASPAVATSTAHGYLDDAIILLSTSSILNDRVVRVVSPTANTFALEGIDTTSVSRYPAGFGVGTAMEVTAWTPLSQTVDTAAEGGEQQYYEWVYMEDGKQRKRPTYKNARTIETTHDYDPLLAWHASLLQADEERNVRVLRASMPNLQTLYWSVIVGFDGEPDFKINENMHVKAAFATQSPVIRYGA